MDKLYFKLRFEFLFIFVLLKLCISFRNRCPKHDFFYKMCSFKLGHMCKFPFLFIFNYAYMHVFTFSLLFFYFEFLFVLICEFFSYLELFFFNFIYETYKILTKKRLTTLLTTLRPSHKLL